MTSTRSYGQACSVAHALDMVGERWSLLIVRELLLGPKRFTDLRAGIPTVSPNVLSQRLRELEGVDVVRNRRLGPPTSAWVYELTDWGRELDAVLIQLGRWGRRSPHRKPAGDASTDALMLAMRCRFRPDSARGLDAEYAVRLDDDDFGIKITDGRLEVGRSTPSAPTATMETDRRTFAGLMTGNQRVDVASAAGEVRLDGDTDAVDRLFEAVA
ncbi:MAG: winged helix-turn-helix transcriptional regulator [Micromonosporaceae bacterium]